MSSPSTATALRQLVRRPGRAWRADAGRTGARPPGRPPGPRSRRRPTARSWPRRRRSAARAGTAGCRPSPCGMRGRTRPPRPRPGAPVQALTAADSLSGRGYSATAAAREATCPHTEPGSSTGGRPASSIATGSPSMRCARKARKRSESWSTQWQSSTSTSSGARSARLTTSQYRLWSASKPASSRAPPAASRANRRAAGPAAPANGSAAPSRAGSSSWRTTPNANGCSSSEPFASSAVRPACSAAARAARASSVLPTPAGPSISVSAPAPARACANPSRHVASSRSRSSRAAAVLRGTPATIHARPPARKPRGNPRGTSLVPRRRPADRAARERRDRAQQATRCGSSSRRCGTKAASS